MHAEHKDLIAYEDKLAQNEIARRQKHSDVEKVQLKELERIERRSALHASRAVQRKEAAVEESMRVIDAAARETRDLFL